MQNQTFPLFSLALYLTPNVILFSKRNHYSFLCLHQISCIKFFFLSSSPLPHPVGSTSLLSNCMCHHLHLRHNNVPLCPPHCPWVLHWSLAPPFPVSIINNVLVIWPLNFHSFVSHFTTLLTPYQLHFLPWYSEPY